MIYVAMIAAVLSLGTSAHQAAGTRPDTPFFCNLKALTPAERRHHQHLTVRLAESIVRSEEIGDGYAFEVDPKRVSMKDVATWTEFERRCCPFFDFTLQWQRENGPLTVRLTGRDGVKAFIRSELPAIAR
jgi:hypothetical protein